MMPPQLRTAKRRNPKARGYVPRPLVELLPAINVNDLKIPKTLNSVVTMPLVSLRYPDICAAKLSAHVVQFMHKGGLQSFRLKWIKTGYGLPRFAFICQCGQPVISLYFHRAKLACRRCHDATYASRICDKRQRPALQAIR